MIGSYRSISTWILTLIWLSPVVPVLSTPLMRDIPRLCARNSVTITQNASSVWPWQQYVSSDAKPPYLEINATGEPLAPGLILFDPQLGMNLESYIPHQAPFIMTDEGELIWSGPTAADASNFRVQTLMGEQVLTYWTGSGGAAQGGHADHGYGRILVYNSSYDQIREICPKLNLTLPPGTTADCQADVHESFITEDNTILLTAYNLTNADLRAIGGPEDGWVLDPLALEIDIHTSEVLFSWSPLAHVSINETKSALSGAGTNSSDAFDFFHTNSIQPFEGNYLINSRATWTTYLVNKKGEILWKIEGETGGDFGALPEGGKFSWEHFARIERASKEKVRLRYFANNNGDPTTSNPSVGLELLLTLPPNPNHPPQILRNVSDPNDPVVSLAMGSHEILSNGNSFLGYGYQPVIKEFGPGNPQGHDVRWSARYNFKNGAASYRIYKTAWEATPSYGVTFSVKKISRSHHSKSKLDCMGHSSSNLRGYVSWNGATNVKYYVLYAGHKKGVMKPVGIFERLGFETEFNIPQMYESAFMQVGAIEDGDTGVVRRSEVVSLSHGNN